MAEPAAGGVDITRARRKPSERVALVEAMVEDRLAQEKDALEWKTGVDLGKKEWHAEIARHVLGFSNRDPNRAARAFDGCAYLILGAEPDNVDGLEVFDSADLESWVNPYLSGEKGPQWDADYCRIRDKAVLVISVEPPRWGQGAFPLRREFDKYRNGEIFIRRMGKTEKANADEIDMLAERILRQRSPDLPFSVVPIGPNGVVAISRDRTAEILWLNRTYGKRFDRPPSATGFLAQTSLQMQDLRGPEKYDAEVERHLREMEATLDHRLDAAAVSANLGAVELGVQNPSDDNFPAVKIDVEIQGAVRAYFDSDDAQPANGFPDPPLTWGNFTLVIQPKIASISPRLHSLGRADQAMNEEDHTYVSYGPIDLRPRETQPLPTVFLLASTEHAETEIIGRWRATTTGASGVVEGELAFAVSGTVSGSALLEASVGAP